MKNHHKSFFFSALNDQCGQAVVWVSASLVAFLGLAGLSIDVGRAYTVQSQLQTSTNAAALSGASAAGLYSTGSASAKSVAGSYASLNPVQGVVSTTISTPCLNILPGGGSCTNDSSGNANGSSVANAVRVKQTAAVTMFIMRIFGMNSITVNAEATAADSTTQPWNVAIILDATGSMGSIDSYCTTKNTTAEQCAMNGIQTMLKGINPCQGSASCSTASANSIFRVSLFSFPNVTSATVAYDYNCKGTPTSEDYTLPLIPPTGSTDAYQPFGYKAGTGGTTIPVTTYQITPQSDDTVNIDANGFSSDYYSGGSLNPNSVLVKVIGNGSKTAGCMKPPSTNFGDNSTGETYFASAIYAAQTALQAEQSYVAGLGIKTSNAIIFVSDGQANLAYGRFPPKTSNAVDKNIKTVTYGDSVTYYNSSSPKYNLVGTGSIGQYPDYHDDCQQAIAAAQYARQQGTRVYAVAYGSEASGCTQDSTAINSTMPLALNVAYTQASQVIPCMVMENIASPVSSVSGMWYFYTDGSSVKNGCSDTTHTSTNLNSIFGAIAATFQNAHLLPNTAT